MPDQSSAATEHAILQEITAPLEHLPDDPIAMVHADFPSALRGYDRMAVDAYVQQISEMVAELQATRSPEAAVRRALERVGEQISGILQRAHETAEQITAQSRHEAEDRLEQARTEANEILATAQQRVKDLDADTDRIWIERHRIVDEARELATQLMGVADGADARFSDPEAEQDQPSTLYDEVQDETIVMSTAALAEQPGEAPSGEPEDGGDADEYDPSPADVELEEAAAEEEEGPGPEPTEDPAASEIEATRRYEPLSEDRIDDDPAHPPPVRGTRAAIPPASQAAHRRTSE